MNRMTPCIVESRSVAGVHITTPERLNATRLADGMPRCHWPRTALVALLATAIRSLGAARWSRLRSPGRCDRLVIPAGAELAQRQA